MPQDKWVIGKQFDFCYSHRVWSQKLNEKFSLDSGCACRHLHGHQGTIIVKLSSIGLKDGMVTDFKHLNFFKKFVDDVLDHKFILDIEDPLFHTLVPEYKGQDIPIKWNEGNWTGVYGIVDPNFFKFITEPHMIELYESFVFVRFVPTSENLCRWFYDLLEDKIEELDAYIESVQFFETPKSQCTFSKDI